MSFALDGIKVLELALQYPGPYCSMILSELGADVLKVEKPGTGDSARRRPSLFNSINRNKRSFTLDLKQASGKALFYRMIREYDVMTEGFRPGVTARLGIDYETLREINPGLIYCSISGYGQSGPYHHLPGHDLNYMALSGMLQCFQDAQGNTVKPGVAIADLSAGMFAAIGILAALAQRHRTGEGRYIEISMIDGLVSWMGANLAQYAETGLTQKQYDPGYGLFTTSDGKSLALGIAHEDWFWDRLCKAADLPELIGIPVLERRERRAELVKPVQEKIARKPLAEWIRLLEAADVPATPVQDMEAVLSDPHARARDMIAVVDTPDGGKTVQAGFPVKFSPPARRARQDPAPALGDATGDVLRQLGYSPEEIERFHKEGTV